MRGRQKGQTKRMSIIKDPVIAPYEIQVEEDQYVLIDTEKDKPLGYYSDLKNAIQKISLDRVRAYRVLRFANIVIDKPNQEKFWLGWFRRALEV